MKSNLLQARFAGHACACGQCSACLPLSSPMAQIVEHGPNNLMSGLVQSMRGALKLAVIALPLKVTPVT